MVVAQEKVPFGLLVVVSLLVVGVELGWWTGGDVRPGREVLTRKQRLLLAQGITYGTT